MPRRNNRRKAEYHKKTYIRKRDWRAFDAIESMRVKETPPVKTRQGRSSTMPVPHRGEVWFTDFGEFDNSSVQRGKRPAVIVSIDVSNEKSGTVTVIPLTSKIKKTWYPSHIPISDEDVDRGGHGESGENGVHGAHEIHDEGGSSEAQGKRKTGKALVPSIVLTEQVRTIDKRSLLSLVGEVKPPKLAEIERGLSNCLGLDSCLGLE